MNLAKNAELPRDNLISIILQNSGVRDYTHLSSPNYDFSISPRRMYFSCTFVYFYSMGE